MTLPIEGKTSTFSHAMLWFGAGVSIAEILAGTLIAPLGFWRGAAAILSGHAIGCLLMYLAGTIGGKTRKSAMETVKISFGEKGARLFSALNVLQLIGWTAVMLASAASAANSIYSLGPTIWSFIIGGFIALWILLGLENLDKVNVFTMAALFILTLVLSHLVFSSVLGKPLSNGALRFTGAVELSIAMPLSWLPLISDYTRTAKRPQTATAVSCLVYFLVSCWMYLIGLGAALFTGERDIALIMLHAGLGFMGLVVVIFSTVTTTFLDVYSAGVSSETLSRRFREKPMALLVCFIGCLLASFSPIERYEDFLYLISSVFVPMTAILLTDYFILKNDDSETSVNWANLFIWILGFGLYQVLLRLDTPIGSTIPDVLTTLSLCLVTHKIKEGKGKLCLKEDLKTSENTPL